MRLGVSVGYWGQGTEPAGQRALAVEAERLGFDSVWASEAYGSDAATVLGWLAAQTSRVALGSAIFQVPARSPAMTAMTAATLDGLSGGRFRLGLGVSGPQVAEGWHGQPYDRPLERLRDHVAVVRLALERRTVRYQGETVTLPRPGGLGKALKLTIRPRQQRLPIYVAAMGPRAVALAGEVADGWLPYLYSPEHLAAMRTHLAEGAARAGRDLDGFDVSPLVPLRLAATPDAARDPLRPLLALYVGGMGASERNFYADLARQLGFGAAAETVQRLYLAGLTEAAAAALPAALIDAMTLCGTPAQVRDRLAAYRDAGATTLLVTPLGPPEQQIDHLRTLADLAA